MKRYRLVESDVATIDPNLKALYEAVEGLEASKPGSAEKFAKIIQTKYGITSTDNLKKFMLGCTKIPVGGVSIAGFALSISGAVTNGAELYSRIKNLGAAGLDARLGFESTASVIACVMLSFIFWKLFRFVIGSSNKTESTNNKSYSEQKAILETEIFVTKMNQFMESDAGNPAVKLNATAEKADGICRRMFNWIKGKVTDGWGWIKKHPYITTAFLVVIGCVFYYISVLRGQIANLQGDVNYLQNANSVLWNNNAELSAKISTLSSQLKQNIDMNEVRKYFATAKHTVDENIKTAIDAGNSRWGDYFTSLENSAANAVSMDKNQFIAYVKSLNDTIKYHSNLMGEVIGKEGRAAELILDHIKRFIGKSAYNNIMQTIPTNIPIQ